MATDGTAGSLLPFDTTRRLCRRSSLPDGGLIAVAFSYPLSHIGSSLPKMVDTMTEHTFTDCLVGVRDTRPGLPSGVAGGLRKGTAEGRPFFRTIRAWVLPTTSLNTSPRNSESGRLEEHGHNLLSHRREGGYTPG